MQREPLKKNTAKYMQVMNFGIKEMSNKKSTAKVVKLEIKPVLPSQNKHPPFSLTAQPVHNPTEPAGLSKSYAVSDDIRQYISFDLLQIRNKHTQRDSLSSHWLRFHLA